MAVITAGNYIEVLDKYFNEITGLPSRDSLMDYLENHFYENIGGSQFFTKDNFEQFLKWLAEEKPYATYDETKQNAGLELIEADVDADGVFHACTPNIGKLEQGKYYWSAEPVKALHIYPYKSLDKAVMGESMIQFKTDDKEVVPWNPDESGNLNKDEIDPYWIISDGSKKPTFKKDSNYQIRLTTDHEGNHFAYLNRYETVDVSNIQNSTDTENPIYWMEITYSVLTSDYTFEPFSKKWVNAINNNAVNMVYYASDGTSYSEKSISDLKSNNKLTANTNNPKILIEFNVTPLDLSYMFENVPVNTFKLKLDAANIESMSYMFAANDKTVKANSIDLTGIYNSKNFRHDEPGNYMFTGLFKGRKINEANVVNLKLFGKDENGELTGINTEFSLSLAEMFMNGPLISKHCNPNLANSATVNDENNYIDGPFNIFRNLKVSSCMNFTNMFSGYENISMFNLKPLFKDSNNNSIINWTHRCEATDKENYMLKFSKMFANTRINDDCLTIINDFIKELSSFGANGKQHQLKSYNFDNIFENCIKIENGSLIDLEELFIEDNELTNISMNYMFYKCTNLNTLPILYLSRENNPNLNNISLNGMFSECGTSRDTINFINASKWWFNYPKNNNAPYGSAPTLSMSNMFKGTPLYKHNDKNGGKTFNFCSNEYGKSSRICDWIDEQGGFANTIMTIQLNNMFANTTNKNLPGNGGYQLNFNLDLGSKDEYQNHPAFNVENNPYPNISGMLDENNSSDVNICNPQWNSGKEPVLYYVLKNKVYNDSEIKNKINIYYPG